MTDTSTRPAAPQMWMRSDIKDYFQVSLNAAGKIVTHATFPKPLVIGQREKWFPDEVIAWAKRQRDFDRSIAA